MSQPPSPSNLKGKYPFAPASMPPFNDSSESHDKFPFEDSLLDCELPSVTRIIPIEVIAGNVVRDPRRGYRQALEEQTPHRPRPHLLNSKMWSLESKNFYFPDRYEDALYPEETKLSLTRDLTPYNSTTRALLDPRLSKTKDCLGEKICSSLQFPKRKELKICSNDEYAIGITIDAFTVSLRPADLEDLEVDKLSLYPKKMSETAPESLDDTMELQEFRDNLLEDALVQHQSTSAPSSATEAPSEDLLKKDQPTVTPPSSVLVPVKPPGNTPANVHKVKPTVITKTTDQNIKNQEKAIKEIKRHLKSMNETSPAAQYVKTWPEKVTEAHIDEAMNIIREEMGSQRGKPVDNAAAGRSLKSPTDPRSNGLPVKPPFTSPTHSLAQPKNRNPVEAPGASASSLLGELSRQLKRSYSSDSRSITSPLDDQATLEQDKLLLARIAKMSASTTKDIHLLVSPSGRKRVKSRNGAAAETGSQEGSDSESDIYEAVKPQTACKEDLELRKGVCTKEEMPHTIYSRSVHNGTDLVFWNLIKDSFVEEAQKAAANSVRRKNGKTYQAGLSTRFDILNKSENMGQYDEFVRKIIKAKRSQEKKKAAELIQNCQRSSSSLINASLDSIDAFNNKRKRSTSPQPMQRNKRQSSESSNNFSLYSDLPQPLHEIPPPDQTFKNVPLKDLELAKHLIQFCPCWVEVNQHNDSHNQLYVEFLFLVHNRYSTIKIEVEVVNRALFVLARNFESVPREKYMLRLALFSTELVKLLTEQSEQSAVT